MITPQDEYERELYDNSPPPGTLSHWHFLAIGSLFFLVATALLFVSRGQSIVPGVQGLLPLASLFVIIATAAFSGWLLVILVGIGRRILALLN